MDITDTKLWGEVEEIIREGERPIHYEYGAVIFYGDEVSKPLKLQEISVQRDYINNSFDVTYARLFVGRGFRDHLVYNERRGLLIHIWRKRYGEVTDKIDKSDEAPDAAEVEDIDHFIYRGTLKYMRSGIIESESIMASNAEESDLANQVILDIQIYPLVTEELRAMSSGGIFKEETPADVLKCLCTVALSNTKTPTEPIIEGIDMVEPDNKTPRRRVAIKQGTSVLHLAQLLQDHLGGIYDYDIGSYIQEKHWYIWPLYNLHRAEKEEKSLTIINVPDNRLPGMERSYCTKNGAVVLLAAGRTVHADGSERARLNAGTGVRYLKANHGMDEFFKVSPDGETWKIDTDRKTSAREVVYDATTDIHEGLGRPHPTRTKQNLVIDAREKILVNEHLIKSRISQRTGSLITVGWDNSRPELIYPGMPVVYVFLANQEPVSIDGVVIAHNFTTGPRDIGVRARRHVALSEIMIYSESPEYMKELKPDPLKPTEDDPPTPNVSA